MSGVYVTRSSSKGFSCSHKPGWPQCNTHALDAIARAGANGLMDPVEPVRRALSLLQRLANHCCVVQGLACGSDTAHMSMFGYDPRTHYRCLAPA